MQNFIAITCPHCGEDFETAFDPDEGGAEFVVDCEVCCRPISVAVRVRNGQIDDVRVTAS
ncbi:MAG TPA: CPXCG motif-containing cysteine-rich protein [Verrucomicrobiae bacterium]|nr:CPXCG motif-containing cysteine-rich protein [Verrucomicrobiae bacterium]